jgi:hypothetical protein
MRLITVVKKNLAPILFVVVVAAILIYMTQRKEGFATCNATNCAAKGGSWINDKCYKPCSSTGTGNVVYQSCTRSLSTAEYNNYLIVSNPATRDSEREIEMEEIRNNIPEEERSIKRYNPTISRNVPCGGGLYGNGNNISTNNTRCGSKLRPGENRPSKNVARQTFSSC